MGSHQLRQKAAVDLIGTAASPSTLTAAYSGNQKRFDCKGLPNIQLDCVFTPGANNEYVGILVEGSNDSGTTWFNVPVIVGGATEKDVFSDGGTLSTSGIPFIIPGDKTSASGTAVSTSVQLTVVADAIRVSARSSGAADFGTLYVRATAMD